MCWNMWNIQEFEEFSIHIFWLRFKLFNDIEDKSSLIFKYFSVKFASGVPQRSVLGHTFLGEQVHEQRAPSSLALKANNSR